MDDANRVDWKPKEPKFLGYEILFALPISLLVKIICNDNRAEEAVNRVAAGEGVGPAGLGGVGDIELDGVLAGMDEGGDVPDIRRGKTDAGRAAVDAELDDLSNAAGVQKDGPAN